MWYTASGGWRGRKHRTSQENLAHFSVLLLAASGRVVLGSSACQLVRLFPRRLLLLLHRPRCGDR